MTINRYPYEKYIRYKKFKGQNEKFECRICGHCTETHGGIKSHILRKHPKQTTTQCTPQKVTEVMRPQELRTEIVSNLSPSVQNHALIAEPCLPCR